MRSASTILADNLRASLAECCGDCGAMSKKLGKKVCCGGKPKADATSKEPELEAEPVLKPALKTEDCTFLYSFPDAEKAKSFAEETQKKYGWRFETHGPVAGMVIKAFADEVAAEFGGKDLLREGVKDPRTKGLENGPFFEKLIASSDKTETVEPHTHPFIKRCVAAMTGKDGSKDAHDPKQLSSAFALCTAAKKAHPSAAKEKAKEGMPASRMSTYEKALAAGRRARAR